MKAKRTIAMATMINWILNRSVVPMSGRVVYLLVTKDQARSAGCVKSVPIVKDVVRQA